MGATVQHMPEFEAVEEEQLWLLGVLGVVMVHEYLASSNIFCKFKGTGMPNKLVLSYRA